MMAVCSIRTARRTAGDSESSTDILMQVEELIQQVSKEHGKIDGVANCVGSFQVKPGHLVTPEEVRDCILVCFQGIALDWSCDQVLPALLTKHYQSIHWRE